MSFLRWVAGRSFREWVRSLVTKRVWRRAAEVTWASVPNSLRLPWGGVPDMSHWVEAPRENFGRWREYVSLWLGATWNHPRGAGGSVCGQGGLGIFAQTASSDL